MSQKLYVGVDAGASKCRVRIEDADGVLIGHATGKAATMRYSSEAAWDAILTTVQEAFQERVGKHALYVGIGIAGTEMSAAYQTFMQYPHPFKQLSVVSDAHTACLGAHLGGDGAIIIAGTGVVGFQRCQGEAHKVGGYGFPFDDEGGGAWMGLQAVQHALKAYDKRGPTSSLTASILHLFKGNALSLAEWADKATSTAYATLAPGVIEHSKQGDVVALQIMKQAACALDAIGEALLKSQVDRSKPLPCALVGGVAPHVKPYLSTALRARLRVCHETPEQGAIRLVKQREVKEMA